MGRLGTTNKYKMEEKKMNKKMWIGLVLIIIIVAVTLFSIFLTQPSEEEIKFRSLCEITNGYVVDEGCQCSDGIYTFQNYQNGWIGCIN